jgi:hypothetical protein
MPCKLTRYRGIAVADGGTPKFMSLVEDALETVDSRPIGAGLLRSIANDGPHYQYKVVIFDARVSDAPTHTDGRHNIRGVGSIPAIYWHPFSAWHPHRRAREVPGFIVLAHELIHARRMLLGIECADDWTSEIHTIGLIVHGGPEGIDPNDRRRF